MKKVAGVPGKKDYGYAYHNHNEIQYLFSGLFLFYKAFVSSQDAQSCSFTPSCSEFGMFSVKKYGAAIGILSSFDRLMRCHGLARHQYPVDPQTGLSIDNP